MKRPAGLALVIGLFIVSSARPSAAQTARITDDRSFPPGPSTTLVVSGPTSSQGTNQTFIAVSNGAVVSGGDAVLLDQVDGWAGGTLHSP
jgi:hypothetical protein